MAVPQTQPGVATFIPEQWVAALMAPYAKSLVFAQPGIINRDYEGIINQKGDTLHVGSIGSPSVKKYDATADMVTEDLTLTDTEFKIDQGDYFNFRVEDVSALQAAGAIKDPAIQKAAEAMAESTDTYVSKLMTAGAKHKLGSSEVAKRGDDAYDLIVELRKKLNSDHTPKDGRFLIVGPELESAILRDERFTRVDAAGTEQTLRNGIIGRILGFDVLQSENAPTVASREYVIAGHSSATTFAQQINKIETAREEKRFADLVKGLNIYGGKVFRPEGLATAEVTLKDPAPAGAASTGGA